MKTLLELSLGQGVPVINGLCFGPVSGSDVPVLGGKLARSATNMVSMVRQGGKESFTGESPSLTFVDSIVN